jgi:prophage regulatory protein
VNYRKILRRPEVEAMTGLGRSSIYAEMAAGRLKRPVNIGLRAVGWLEQDIIEWQNERIAERDRKVPPARVAINPIQHGYVDDELTERGQAYVQSLIAKRDAKPKAKPLFPQRAGASS